jgi:hypothetical protein
MTNSQMTLSIMTANIIILNKMTLRRKASA